MRRYAVALVWAVEALLACRFFWVVKRFAVNLFFYDEWGNYGGLFDRAPWSHFFLEQNGPHRQGVGVTLAAFLLKATHWDSRMPSFLIAAAIVCASLLALRLKLKLFGPLRPSDVAMPVMFLGLGQWEVLLGAPGPSAQAFPLLLLVLYCLSWTETEQWRRYSAIVVLNFLLIYTGYGIFVAPITLTLLAVDCYQRATASPKEAWLPLAAWIASAGSLALFFLGYVFRSAAACFQFPYPSPSAYPVFMGFMFAKFLGLKHGTVFPAAIGIFFVLLSVGVCGRQFWSVWKCGIKEQRSFVGFTLAAYTLLYASAAAVGRVCLGMQAAGAARNLTLLIPGFLALYFQILMDRDSRRRNVLGLVFVLILIPGCVQRNHKEIEGFSAMKRAWKDCYRRTENIKYCDQVSHLQLFPWPEGIHMREKLEYLKQNRLNLYANSD